jgi:hypothetical protein
MPQLEFPHSSIAVWAFGWNRVSAKAHAVTI